MHDKSMIRDLEELIRIPSVYDPEGAFGEPFGRDVERCLEKILQIGTGLGFKAKNYDGYAGELDLGEGSKIIGVLGHCDVVAPGEGWSTDPFEPVIKDGRLYGRGSSDDKGALLACMYAAKRLKDNRKLPSDVMIRIIIGTNEEEDWNDIPHYLEKTENLPLYSIVPDAQFPVIYCEKGLYDIDLLYVPDNCQTDRSIILERFEGGSARNAVAARAEATLRFTSKDDDVRETAQLLKKLIYEKGFDGIVSEGEDLITVVMNGRNAHAMNPEKGINAGARLIEILSALPEEKFSHSGFVKEFRKLIGEDYLGEKAGLACRDEESGDLTVSVGVFRESDDGLITKQASIRYPASADFEQIKAKTADGLGGGKFTIREISHMKSVYFKKDDPFVRLLMDVYREVSGDCESEPISIGGATYARAIPNAVAFGPLFPWEEELAHEPDEFVDLDSLQKAGEVYYRTFERICELLKGDNL